MGLENHRYRYGRLINVLVIVATLYNPTYKNKPEDAQRVVGFCFLCN
jgi:hypothetical protein